MKSIKIFCCLVPCFLLTKVKGQFQVPQYLDCVKINHLAREACHNCYDPGTVSFGTFKQALDATRVVELDIHSHDTNTGEAPSGIWYVRHNATGFNNNNNNCGALGDGDFSVCLQDIKDWHDTHLGHDPIIVFIDLKPKLGIPGNDFWRPNHGTIDLDNVFNQFALALGGLDMIYKPSDLQGSFSQLRFAAQNENWPSLGNLKNKFMFVLTADNIYLDEYLTNVGIGAKAFVAVRVNGNNPSLIDFTYPPNISPNNLKQVVFYNLDDQQAQEAQYFIPDNGYMSRSWQSTPTNAGQYYNNILYNVNNIAIKNIGSNVFPPMNRELIGINTITVGGTTSSPQVISSQYNSILQDAQIKLTTQNLIVQSGTHYNLRAGEEVDLLPGTDIQMGATTDISIGDCASYANNMRINPNANGGGRELSQNEAEWMLNEVKVNDNTTQESVVKEPEPPLVYPNPAKEVVYIDYSNATTTLAIFTLYDLTGRIVKTKTYNAQNGDSPTFGLSVNELKAGTYFYTLQVGEKTYNGKLVKMGY